ncbi:MAG: hypothetical protein ACI4XC_02735 [Eubacterium sp.]
MEILTLILSIVGALAWLPHIVELIRKKCRNISANVVDYELITDSKAYNHNDTKSITGSIVLMAVNMFIPYESFFVEQYNITVNLKSGSKADSIIVDGDFTIHTDNGDILFSVPDEYNFNLHKEIIHDKDNIRILKIMLKSTKINVVEEIESFEIVLKNKGDEKTVNIKLDDLPEFNKMNFLSNFKERGIF